MSKITATDGKVGHILTPTIVASTLLALVACGGSPVHDYTTCDYAASAFDRGDSSLAKYIDEYISRVMTVTDNENRLHVIGKLSDDGFGTVRAAVISYCRQHRSATLHDASVTMLEGIYQFRNGGR